MPTPTTTESHTCALNNNQRQVQQKRNLKTNKSFLKKHRPPSPLRRTSKRRSSTIHDSCQGREFILPRPFQFRTVSPLNSLKSKPRGVWGFRWSLQNRIRIRPTSRQCLSRLLLTFRRLGFIGFRRDDGDRSWRGEGRATTTATLSRILVPAVSDENDSFAPITFVILMLLQSLQPAKAAAIAIRRSSSRGSSTDNIISQS